MGYSLFRTTHPIPTRTFSILYPVHWCQASKRVWNFVDKMLQRQDISWEMIALIEVQNSEGNLKSGEGSQHTLAQVYKISPSLCQLSSELRVLLFHYNASSCEPHEYASGVARIALSDCYSNIWSFMNKYDSRRWAACQKHGTNTVGLNLKYFGVYMYPYIFAFLFPTPCKSFSIPCVFSGATIFHSFIESLWVVGQNIAIEPYEFITRPIRGSLYSPILSLSHRAQLTMNLHILFPAASFSCNVPKNIQGTLEEC